MDPQLEQRLAALEQKIDATYRVAASARRMFVWTIIISIGLVVLPLIGLAFTLPTLLSSFNLDQLVQ